MSPEQMICPLCGDTVHKLLYQFHVEAERVVIDRIKEENPSWTEWDGICGRCIDYYQVEIVMQHRNLPGIGPHFPVKSPDDFIILPTPIRLNADPRFTGKGVTICFIDSGFYPHPDLVETRYRIRAMIDATGNDLAQKPLAASWHGTMTSVVAAGDGYLSNGLYKGIASEAELVLIKVQDQDGRISTGSLVRALNWVYDHHDEYNIRIVNMSVSDDLPESAKTSEVDQLASALFKKGVLIVAAVGNDENMAIRPPANSPDVIAVGGINDANRLDPAGITLYHSSFGKTIDGYYKPELVANAMWIAAPILPGTEEKKEAEIIHKEQLTDKIRDTKFFSPDYMHVDGTSFAAPIVSSVLAQMIEADPSLEPAELRNILFSTAKRFESLPAERQGYGYVQPRNAVLKALRSQKIISVAEGPVLNVKQKTIRFSMSHSCAQQVALSGSFNDWKTNLLMEPCREGNWSIDIPMLPPGSYQYKFLVDGKNWVEDVSNPFREPDGVNGWNSVLKIE